MSARLPGTVDRPHTGKVARRLAGFTLIELLLAIVIFAIVLVAIHTVFYGAVRLRNKATQAVEEALPLQQALTIIKRDLENIVLPGSTLCGELETTRITSNSTNSLDLLSPVEDAVIGQSGPAFFTASGILSETTPWAEVERVRYYLAAPTNNTLGKDLIRSTTRNLLPTWPEEPVNQSLLSGVQSIVFSFYDGLQWREYWDSSTETNKLPSGIKVELQLASASGNPFRAAPVALVVPVVLQAGTNQTGSGGEP